MRRLTTLLLLLALAGVTMGQEGCESDPTTTDEPTTEEQQRQERKREKRAERKREKRREEKRREREQGQTPPAPTTTEEAPTDACHPSYVGACLDPSASDYDCEGGSGDGPKYVSGPIRVVGDDPFDLDRDGDGTACDT